MAHQSRLAGISIDCDTGNLDRAADFWRAAFGDTKRRKTQGDDKYVVLDRQRGLNVEVQRVDHPSRVHIDIETDDIEAEATRLEALGARRVEKIETWLVMEAPTGHRFCLIRGKGRKFKAKARVWQG